MTDLFGNLKAQGITFETHVKVIWRNPTGKIIRIDKARGVDPLLERWTHIGSSRWGGTSRMPLGSAPLPVDPRRSYGRRWSEGCLRLPRCVIQHRHPALGKHAGLREARQKNPGTRPKRTLRISGMRFKEWMRNHPANPLPKVPMRQAKSCRF